MRVALAFLLAALVLLVSCGGEDESAGGAASPSGDEGSGNPADSTTPVDATATPAADQETVAAIENLDFPSELIDGNAIGDPDAPLHLVVYEDFQCPHCLAFTAEVEPVLLDEFVREGDLLLEVRHFPVMGNASAGAAVAAECARQEDAFWEYHRQLFLQQATGGPFTGEAFEAIASDLGLDEAAFAECLRSDATIQTVSDEAQEARTAGITGTPGFILDGETLAPAPADAAGWRTLLQERLSAGE
ncbi:MAG: thioredoxin domain-containing protein [Dehalococcoidia bacterium]|nr:thioredoxin domain-containing protein [Dehalococcoidia bacterium]